MANIETRLPDELDPYILFWPVAGTADFIKGCVKHRYYTPQFFIKTGILILRDIGALAIASGGAYLAYTGLEKILN